MLGLRLQDEDGNDFLVLITHRTLWTPKEISEAYGRMAEWNFQFPVVIADKRPSGEYFFIGDDSLTAIARATIHSDQQWVVIPMSK